MAATISEQAPKTSLMTGRLPLIISSVLIAGLVGFLSRQGLVVLALLAVVAVTLWPVRGRLSAEIVWAQATQLIMGASVVIIIALMPKALSQLAVMLLYAAWRIWHDRLVVDTDAGLVKLLLLQLAAFEALFLMAAIWQTPRPVLLVLVWLAVYITSYQALTARRERGAGVLAAAWALTATEASWIFLTWLVSYVTPGQYLIVPQPTLVLTALAYCFGSIYSAQRSGQLNRGRLTEYLLIGFVLLAIVIAGTTWRGTL